MRAAAQQQQVQQQVIISCFSRGFPRGFFRVLLCLDWTRMLLIRTSFLARITCIRGCLLRNKSENASKKYEATATQIMERRLKRQTDGQTNLKSSESKMNIREEIRKELKELLHALRPTSRALTSATTDSEEWQMIYKFKYILQAKVIQKAKLFQTLFTLGLGLSTVVAFVFNLSIGVGSLVWTTFISTFTLAMLVVVGNICRRLVGIAYLNRKQDLVKLSHLSFYGKRQDCVISVNDFLPFAFTPKNDLYFKLFVTGKGSGNYFYICPKLAEIPDLKLFAKALGELPVVGKVTSIPNQRKANVKKPETTE